MKCINCCYFPCIRIECEIDSCCDYYKSIVQQVAEELEKNYEIREVNK